MLEKLKKMAEQAKVKAGPMVEQAKEKAGPMVEQAKEKAGPMAEQAKEKATELAGKAAPAVSQGLDKAAGSLDKATKGRYTDKIDKVQGVVHQTAQKVGDKAAATGTGAAGAPTSQSADFGLTDPVLSEPVSPVVIPAEPVSTTPPVDSIFDTDPRVDETPEDRPKI